MISFSEQPVTPDAAVARLERIPFGRFHLRVASLLGIGTFFDAFDSLVIASVLPVIFTQFDVNFANTGLLIGSAYVGQFIGAILLGAMAERYGRKKTFILSLAAFGLFSLGTAVSWNFETLLVMRFVQGIGLGAEVPLAGALFNEFVRGRSRGRVVMIYESIFSWGILLAPLVSVGFLNLFGDHLGWRLLLALGGLPLVVAVIAYWKLPESPRWLTEIRRMDKADTILREMEDGAWARGVKLAPAEVGKTASADTKPTRLAELFSAEYRQRTILSWATWFCGYFILYGFSTWLPSLYVRIGHLSAQSGLLLTALASAVYLAEIYVFAFTVDRVGRKPWFVAGFGLAVVGCAFGAIAAFTGNTGWPVLFVGGLLLGLGITPVTAGVYLYTPELYPTRMRAWATSSSSSWNRVASAIGPIIFGQLLAAGLGLTSIFIMLGGIAIVGVVVMLTLGVETKQQTLEELAS